jgi:hypothetical protein
MNYFDSENPAHIKQLHSSVNWSIEQMKDRREQRLLHYAQYVGHLYSGENVADDAVPINMIELGINILQRFLTSHSPQVDIGSDYHSFLPAASDLTLACNQEANRIDLADTFNTWTIEALFCMGILEVGITTKDTPPDGEGNLYDPGHVFVDPILFDRAILDMCAARKDQMYFMGHDYTVPIEWARNNPSFEKSVREAITAPNPEEQDDDIAVEGLSHSLWSMETLMPMITLRQLWFPNEKMIMQFVVGQEETSSSNMPLQRVDWEGPERGPYHFLEFGKVPGNLIPNAPVPQWAPMHDQLNSLWNKITDQGERQKTLLLIRGAAAADGNRVVNANDGDAIYSEDPKGCVEMTTGGANPQTFALAMQCKEILDWFMGNISSLGGLAAQSETYGQDKLIAQSASGKPQNLQEITLDCERKVFEDLAFWLYNDPISEYHLVKTIAGTNESIEFPWGPEDRAMGDLTKYNFRVDSYSRPNRSPSEKANTFMQYLQLFMSGEQGMQQQGMGLDWEYIVKSLSRFSNMPEVRRMIRYIQGEAYPERAAVEKPGMAPNTTRTNVRVNRAAPTMQGKNAALISTLMGAGAQPSEQANMLRPVA